MSRETENVLLLLVGLSGVMIVLTGTYTRYVKASLMPWLLAGAVVIALLAAAAIIRDIRRGGPTDRHGEHHHRSRMVWLLVVPVIVLTFIKPPPIGAKAAETTVTPVSAGASHRPFPPLPAGRAPEVALPDVLMRVAQDSAGTLDGRLITVRGFTMRDGDRVDLARVVIICCAADAQLARIRLGGPAAAQAAAYPEDSWLRIEGEVRAGQNDPASRTLPELTVQVLTPIAAPPNTYAY